jgi:hypothetical protein
MKELLLDALAYKYMAEMKDAHARFQVYLNNSVGIGEHPQITEEMDKIVAQYTDAKDKLQSLNKIKIFDDIM